VAVSAISIAISFITAAIILDLLGVTMNALTFAGLLAALTVIIDDAAGDAQNILRRIHENRDAGGEEPARAIVREAAREMRVPMMYAVAIILLAVLPVVIARGLTATFLDPLAGAYALAVVSSLIVALTVTPALSVLLLSSVGPRRAMPQILQRLRARADAILHGAIRTPRPILLVLSLIGLVGVAMIPFLEAPSRPTFKDKELVAHCTAVPGTSLTEMDRITRRAAAQLRATPGVKDVAASVGRASLSDQFVGTNSAELWVRMDQSADYGSARAAVERVVQGVPGIRGGVDTYEGDRSAGVLGEPSSAVSVRIYGQSYPKLRAKARELERRIAGVDGVQRTHIAGLPVEEPTLKVAVNLDEALRHELKPGDVRRAVSTSVLGLTAGNFFQAQKVFDV